jgi:poly[(R)-3-hydroxyalkanoate] polymerase subunit PhaC
LADKREHINWQPRAFRIDAALDAVRRSQFGVIDNLRRLQGNAVAAFGLGPSECSYQIIASGPHWRLRDYGSRNASASLLIVATPIKRTYIWDLAPSTSAIRYCLQQHLHAHLLEWLPATRDTSNNGIDESALAISNCVAKISAKSNGSKPFLIGHSLGGTLATIYGAMSSETVRGLVLLGAPLCFQPGESQFRDILVSLVPSNLLDAEPFPGSLLSYMSAMASPSTFIWSRLMDAALSVTDPHAMDVHARIERWALDEVPVPGKLVQQIIGWLYRDNLLCRGALQVRGHVVGPSNLSIPILAVVNVTDEVAPLVSVKPFIDAIPTKLARMIEYPGELGVCLQHLGILVGRQAYANVWPQIISWLKDERAST